MLAAIASFLVVFLLVLAGGVLLFNRQGMVVHRISSAIYPAPKRGRRTLKGALGEAGTSIGSVVERFTHVLPRSETEKSATRARLDRSGLRGDAATNVFNGSKIVVPLLLCALAALTGLGKVNPYIVYPIAVGLGYLSPDFWLDKRIKSRQRRIRIGLPDVLDMLVICTEAGLSLDQATVRTAEELSKAHPDICDELGVVALQQRAGRARSDAWKEMAERTNVDSLRNLVSMLVQSERFGTSVAKTMRTHAEGLRTLRMQTIEELAAKTTVKLIFPLVLFIFPSLFLVTLGPAIILGIESFSKMNNH